MFHNIYTYAIYFRMTVPQSYPQLLGVPVTRLWSAVAQDKSFALEEAAASFAAARVIVE